MTNIGMKKNRELGVAFFPTVRSMSGNPYWLVLAAELEKKGFFLDQSTPAFFNLKWLLSNRKWIKVLHLHYVQQFYSASTYIRKLKLLVGFGANMLLARILGYRTVFTLHNLEPTYQHPPAWMDYLGHWIAANLSERVIVHCNEARRLLKKRYGRRNNVFFVDHPNFIQFYSNTITKEAARKKLELPDTSIVFTFIGGVRPNKGVEILIKAFHELANQDIRLVIAGNVGRPESYAQSLMEMAHGDDRISFHLKLIPDEEMQVFMNVSDIVVLPFAKILTSSTANLALSFAKPVIVPAMGCLPELVAPEFGWLFEPDNVVSLSSVMQNAMSSDYQQIGQNAFKKVSAFTPEHFAAQTIRAYWD